MAVRVLVVEDEPALAAAVARGLRQEGMAVDGAGDGASGLAKALVVDYDVVVLDRDLPVIHGDEVCRSICREQPRTRILMLTAAGLAADVVVGLGLGADDYLAKPFDFEVLVARVHALARRSVAARPPILRWRDLELDPARREVTRAGRVVPLTGKEFGVLEALLSANGDLVSAEELLVRVWDENVDPFSNVVRVTIMRLRRRLDDPPIIDTVAGAGYGLR